MRDSNGSYVLLPCEDSSSSSNRLRMIVQYLAAVWKDIVILLLIMLVLPLALLQLRYLHIGKTPTLTFTGPKTHEERWIQYLWNSEYSNGHGDTTDLVEEAWDKIVPAHGIVALGHELAAEQNLPASHDLPSDSSKGVYILDAYHQIHCLTIIRKTFNQVMKDEPLTYPTQHSLHCFDTLRQYVMCTAGDTPLYTQGKNTTGDGQVRKCRNWSALRDWATEHSACYRDSETPIPLNEHFGHCDDGTDGLAIDWRN